MNQKNSLESLLNKLKDKGIKETQILLELERSFLDTDPATFIDHQREERCGYPEVIYGLHKSAERILSASREILKLKTNVLISRINQEKANILITEFPDAFYCETAQIAYIGDFIQKFDSKLLIISAGTSDESVVKEAYYSALAFGLKPTLIQDLGVAGLHRLLAYKDELSQADCIIVAAGMEGALPSVVGGLTTAPIIAVPTSVGYGANMEGVTTMMAMLSSCASGLSVVNIDNGFGAAYAALRMIKTFEKK
ncbi:nickel pincer cofactor biosynthesis protein LarB [Lentisphaera profundi]|uniref:Nickel pincer cofactor biosynthesis protein LarB n=1 Tax=Lentisphaera profundi TaxID=1658616 RepID=A0ABY7VPL7_9BACT|nr:nickel pincer cofactor biosynthesis protein LarB [Lentisphaera profundi]WDE95647.1 nickel pincer cofactor biosynthesis protein LarB [Lentisphaera profundi]